MATSAAGLEELDTDLLLQTLVAFKAGDFSARLPASWTGVEGKIADTLNEVIARNERLSLDLQRLRQVVGREGRINHRVSPGGLEGGWASPIHAVNDLVDDLVRPTSETARVITAVAGGDRPKKEGVAGHGQILALKNTVNAMVGQLNAFASEVTRVAREVGTEGKLGGQAHVRGTGGVWKDLTDNVNLLAGQLTSQIRNIAEVTTAVANGDLSKKVTVDVQGGSVHVRTTIKVM